MPSPVGRRSRVHQAVNFSANIRRGTGRLAIHSKRGPACCPGEKPITVAAGALTYRCRVAFERNRGRGAEIAPLGAGVWRSTRRRRTMPSFLSREMPLPVDTRITDITHITPQAVAPGFPYSSVGITVTMLTDRLSRIFDRILEKRLAAATESVMPDLRAGFYTLCCRVVHRPGHHPEDLLRTLGRSHDRGPVHRLCPAPGSVGNGCARFHCGHASVRRGVHEFPAWHISGHYRSALRSVSRTSTE